ncbi:hypothetical protein ACJ41O_011669 [Fusarium nematophilum]
MDNAPATPSHFHPTWEKWLCDVIGIRERLRLLSRTADALSDTFLYVLQHRPDKFLGLFEHLWLHEKSNLLEKPTLRSEIQDLSANHLCRVNFPLKLRETWLPFERLQDLVQRYMEHPEQFPFLIVEQSDMAQFFGTRWDFLSKYFSVGKDDGLDFLLGILDCIQRSCPEPSSVQQTQKVFDLYVAIYAKLAVADDEPAARRQIREYFYERGILDPDEKAPMWTWSSCCLWVAPPDMVTKHSLRTIYSRTLLEEQMGNVENLFQRTLGIPDASLKDLVTELEVLRDEGCQRYNRTAFEASPLIYHETPHGEPGWYRTSDCLWSSETEIRGKVILDGCWESDKRLFVGKLGVKLLTLQMVYDELRQSPQSSTDEIKVAILSLNGLLQAERTLLDPEPIRKAKIFPVRYPNGTVVLSSVGVDFAIGDRDKLRTKFQDKISLLDFDLEDVRRLKPFFEWTSLQDRYLSNSVTERTSISSDPGRPISSRNRDLKCKAYYIARVAATFNSPRFEDDPRKVYEQLRTMAVMEIDGISSVLEMFQNRQRFQVEVATANEHIDDTSERLTIYVPEERKAQELCFGSVLPRKLAAWLMRRPTSDNEGAIEADAVNALTSIFACDRSVLDDILDDQGIIQVPFGNEDESDGDDDEDGDEDEEEEEEEEEQPQSDSRFETDGASSGQQITPTHSSTNDSSSPYTGPSDGAFDMSDMQDALSGIAGHADGYESFDGLDVMRRFRSANQLERDKKVGAAGELYVFELLSKLELPDWDRGNWQSTIRKYVTIHPDYRDMEPWNTRETADLVYVDTAGHFTDTLIGCGCLDNEWHGARPKYYIEVKTTTGPCGTPFYMSGNQYQLTRWDEFTPPKIVQKYT